MNKTIYKVLLSTALILSVTMIGIRIYYVNVNAIQQQIEYYSINQEVQLDGCFLDIVEECTNGYAVTVHSAKLTTYGEFAERFEGSPEPQSYELSSQSKIIELDLTIKNEDNQDGYIFLKAWGLQSHNDEWIPCTELWGIEFSQANNSFSFALKPNSEMRISVPFETNNDYELMHGDYPIEDNYYLVISQAPVKKMIKIDL